MKRCWKLADRRFRGSAGSSRRSYKGSPNPSIEGRSELRPDVEDSLGVPLSAGVGSAVGSVEQVDRVGDLDRAATLLDLAGDLEDAADVARDDDFSLGGLD